MTDRIPPIRSTTVPAPPLLRVDAPWSMDLVTPDGTDVEIVHRWMNEPHVAPFWKWDRSLEVWRDKIRWHLEGEHSRPFLLRHEGEPLVYLQVYRPILDEIGEHYPADPHDLAIHACIGDVARTAKGLGKALFPLIRDALFEGDPECRRILGDGAVGHPAINRVAEAAGYRKLKEIQMRSGKVALLTVYPRTPQDMPPGYPA